MLSVPQVFVFRSHAAGPSLMPHIPKGNDTNQWTLSIVYMTMKQTFGYLEILEFLLWSFIIRWHYFRDPVWPLYHQNLHTYKYKNYTPAGLQSQSRGRSWSWSESIILAGVGLGAGVGKIWPTPILARSRRITPGSRRWFRTNIYAPSRQHWKTEEKESGSVYKRDVMWCVMCKCDEIKPS